VASKQAGEKGVGTAIAVLGNFESDRWDADVYAAMALASQLSALVKSRALTVSFAYQLWKLNSSLSEFFSEVRKAIEKGASPDEDVTPERILEAAQTLRKLHGRIKTIYAAAKHSGLTNNLLTAGQFHNISKHGDNLLELVELLELSLNPEVIQAIFDRASAERDRGEVFELSQVE